MSSPNRRVLTLLFSGDTNLQNRADPTSAFVRIKPVLQSADVIFGHLEGLLVEPQNNVV